MPYATIFSIIQQLCIESVNNYDIVVLLLHQCIQFTLLLSIFAMLQHKKRKRKLKKQFKICPQKYPAGTRMKVELKFQLFVCEHLI